MNLGQFKLFVSNIPDEYNGVEVLGSTDDEGNSFRELSGIGIELGRDDYGEWEFFEEGYHDEEDKEDYTEVAVVW